MPAVTVGGGHYSVWVRVVRPGAEIRAVPVAADGRAGEMATEMTAAVGRLMKRG